MPRAKTGAPPSWLTLPPDTAEFPPMFVALSVPTVGGLGVVKLSSFPYPVPSEFVA
jgi:hypothetical protein